MLHPVGPLPAAVYWRRRVVVLLLLLALLGGGGWLGWMLVTGWDGGAADGSSTAEPRTEIPRLERVVLSVDSLRTLPPASDTGVIGLAARAPAAVAVGGRPTVELVGTNASPVRAAAPLDGLAGEPTCTAPQL